jgi:hypothetical protein
MKQLLSAFFLLNGALFAGPILYTIGPNANGLANQLLRIDVDAATVSTEFTIGADTRRFGGGLLASGSAQFIGLETAGGQTFLVFFNSGQTTPWPIGIRPAFQGGGMTLAGSNPGQLFWMENDVAGNSALSLSGLIQGPVGSGFNGGLSYRTSDSKFYALNNSNAGVSTLQTFDETTLSFAPLAIALGSGFTGGLAWDPATDLFYALASDANKNTTLYRFAATDAAPTALFSIGQGFEFASLSVDPGDAAQNSGGGQSQVPEPSTLWITSAGALALLLRRRAGGKA